MTRLHELAHARAGDKGNLNTIAVIAYDPADWPRLRQRVTADVVAAHLRDRFPGGVERFEMPNIHALIFVCRRAAGDTVTTSLHLDAHAKTVAARLLELEID